MKLSVRTKILAAYGGLITLFLLILLSGFSQLKSIASHLDRVQLNLLPLAKTVTSFSNFYHLDESFDVSKMLSNRSNPLFLDSISITNPRLMKKDLSRMNEELQTTLAKESSQASQKSLRRIQTMVVSLAQEHDRYVDLIVQILAQIKNAPSQQVLARNVSLFKQKRAVREKIETLTQWMDELIRKEIHSTVSEERYTVFLILGLSILTTVLAVVIGLVAITSLRPLKQLKKAAQEIAAGDLCQRVKIQSMDEVGDLAIEFNRMADSIQARDEVLRHQQEQLLQSQKMAVVGHMASKISHEIRNPLNALSLNIEILGSETQEDTAKQTFVAISKEIERLNRIAEHYLSLSRSPHGQVQDIDLHQVLSQLELLIRPECEKGNIHFQLEVDAELQLLRLDQGRLEQALLNLVRNGMEAMSQGGTLGIQCKQEENSVSLTVWDTGPGISKDVMLHIFEPFYTTKEKGTGLGLAITNEIIREQGGTMECHSEVGQGAAFSIHFPTLST